jgi:hypothetical protein
MSADKESFMQALVLIGGLVSFICLIMVLLKMYPIEGTGKTILGFFCGIFSFVWGWQHSKDQNLQPVMIAWTVAIVVGLVGNVLAAGK